MSTCTRCQISAWHPEAASCTIVDCELRTARPLAADRGCIAGCYPDRDFHPTLSDRAGDAGQAAPAPSLDGRVTAAGASPPAASRLHLVPHPAGLAALHQRAGDGEAEGLGGVSQDLNHARSFAA